jgi:hypothetical protein
MFHLITFQLSVQTYQETNVLQEQDIHTDKSDDMLYELASLCILRSWGLSIYNFYNSSQSMYIEIMGYLKLL